MQSTGPTASTMTDRKSEPRRALTIGRAAEDLRRFAPDDKQDRLVRRGLRHLPLPRDAPVAQHDHAIGNFEHFVETVRDVDHRDAAGAQAAQRREQPRHLIGGQACGRLVEDKDFGLGGERARDRHQRFFGAAQILDACVGIDVGAERLERGRGAAARRGPSRSCRGGAESRASCRCSRPPSSSR